jgi:CheY-like chemotaxis protein
MSRPLILLVDDEYDLLAAMARQLRAAGYNVNTARDGESALKEASGDSRPDIVISDVMMPGLNGFQMTRKLKSDPETRSIPVLLMSGKVEPADRYWAEETGAAALLPKPVDSRKLLDQVASLLQK